MSSKEYIESLIKELEDEGVTLDKDNNYNEVTTLEDSVIAELENVTNKKFSDEQLKILKSRGSSCILACAGSGKTSVSVALIAKRILTGEIRDTSKLIFTTFSKAGANEMKDRLNSLLASLGKKHIKVDVKTIHSFFLNILRTFGVNYDIISSADRSRMIKQACSDANFSLKNDDLLIIDNLLSFQINNLLSDEGTINAYVNTLEELDLEKYKIIRRSYSEQKNIKKVIDYDDMQSYLYLWLVKWGKSNNNNELEIHNNVRNYCKALYDYFYIDEAQDVSKLQFSIIKAIISTNNKLDKELVFIGDDDQCLIEGTKVKVPLGYKNIEDIQVGDIIVTAGFNGAVLNTRVNAVGVKEFNGEVIEIVTSRGNRLTGTLGHTAFVEVGVDISGKRLTYKNYDELKFENLKVGMVIPVYDEVAGENIDDEIVEINKKQYSGKIYDLEVPSSRNFIANGIVVHNCIYTWRGSDSSIILTMSSIFNIPNYVLSTNYRCNEEIVKYASAGIRYNNGRYDKSMKAFNTGGKVDIQILNKDDLMSLSESALYKIKEWLSEGIRACDIAVLSRNNFHQSILNNMLLRDGIYSNSTDDMKFTKGYIFNDIKDLLEMLKDSYRKNLTSKMLWRVCKFLGTNNANMIAKFQDDSNISFKQCIGYIVKTFINTEVEFNQKFSISTKPYEQIRYITGKLSEETKLSFKVLYTALNEEDEIVAVETLFSLYRDASSFMYKSKDKSRTLAGFLNYFYSMIKEDGVDKTLDFLRVTEQLENGKMLIPGDKVDLCTIHGAKGREWKKVIMFACDNISQPSFDGIVSMIKDNVSIRDISENISEERRLFYVGNTRAKEELVVISGKVPSIFMLEALGVIENTSSNNYNIIELAQQPYWYEMYKDSFEKAVGESKYNK